jgi:membrane-associated phospholipid phosphatase
MIMLFFWSSGRWARAATIAYALAMSLTLVYAGEHYVTDVLLGWIYAFGVYFAYDRIAAAIARRRTLATAMATEPPGANLVAAEGARESAS